MLFYVLAVLLIGIPALMSEWTLGRETRRGPVGAFARGRKLPPVVKGGSCRWPEAFCRATISLPVSAASSSLERGFRVVVTVPPR